MSETEQKCTFEEARQHQRLHNLKRSAERLIKFIELKAPTILMAMEVHLMWKKMWGVSEEGMKSATTGMMIDLSRRWEHKCQNCGKDMPYPTQVDVEYTHDGIEHERVYCKACWDDFNNEPQ